MYLQRSDQPGTRGRMPLEQALKEVGKWQDDVAKDAVIRVLRDDFTTYKEFRWAQADDGYWAWHVFDPEEEATS